MKKKLLAFALCTGAYAFPVCVLCEPRVKNRHKRDDGCQPPDACKNKADSERAGRGNAH